MKTSAVDSHSKDDKEAEEDEKEDTETAENVGIEDDD
jgi:hypothetical protein